MLHSEVCLYPIFKILFSHYYLIDGMVCTRDDCCNVVNHKVSCGDKDMLDTYISMEDYFASMSFIQMVNL